MLDEIYVILDGANARKDALVVVDALDVAPGLAGTAWNDAGLQKADDISHLTVKRNLQTLRAYIGTHSTSYLDLTKFWLLDLAKFSMFWLLDLAKFSNVAFR